MPEMKVNAEEKKAYRLPADALAQAVGGVQADGGLVHTCVRILAQMGLDATEEFVKSLIERGGSTLRDWAKAKTIGDPRCNLLPTF